MLETAVGDVLGDARLYLSGVTTDGATTVCTFSYILNGIPVRCGDAPAAAVTFTGRAVTELRLLAAGFSLSAETLKIIPPTQAMAILPAGGALKPEYARARAGSLTAGWQSAQ